VIESEVFDFVRFSIRSVWNVELLLYLRRAGDRAWAPEELVRELRASASVVKDGLDALQTGGLAAPDQSGLWRYAPASPVFDRLTTELGALYRERPTAVTGALFATKHDPLRSFADAFRLRKD
jgi:hypothetical protein